MLAADPRDRMRAIEMLDRYAGIEQALIETGADVDHRADPRELMATFRRRVARVLPQLGLRVEDLEAALAVQRALSEQSGPPS
jgi:hypothetical protein